MKKIKELFLRFHKWSEATVVPLYALVINTLVYSAMVFFTWYCLVVEAPAVAVQIRIVKPPIYDWVEMTHYSWPLISLGLTIAGIVGAAWGAGVLMRKLSYTLMPHKDAGFISDTIELINQKGVDDEKVGLSDGSCTALAVGRD